MSHPAAWMLTSGLVAIAVGGIPSVPLLVLVIRADRRAEAPGGPRISARDNWNLFRASTFRFYDYHDANPTARKRLVLRQWLFKGIGIFTAGIICSLIGLLTAVWMGPTS